MKYYRFLILTLFACSMSTVLAQSELERFRKGQNARHENFRKQRQTEYEAFRARINNEYAAFVERIWNNYKAFKGIPMPDDTPVPPVTIPKEDKDKPIEDNPVVIEEVVTPVIPQPQPEPIKPISPNPTPTKKFSTIYHGTKMEVRLDKDKRFVLSSTREEDIANIWRTMSDGRFDAAIADCLELRKKHNLNDWAYLMMLKRLCDDFYQSQCNESMLMLSYIYCQSGYKMRLAKSSNRIIMLFASKHQIFNHPYFSMEGDSDYFYALDKTVDDIQICQATFPHEQSLSLTTKSNPIFDKYPTIAKERQAEGTGLRCETVSEKNLIDYYATYPSSMIDNNPMTRWAIYANTPLSDVAHNCLYPQMKSAMNQMTKTQKVALLLDWVQTAFVYEYDDKVWGEDRAFFADESLYYPYCDCEDRSILFTRMVRDLVGLPCILVYYPGHLAAAVCFDEQIKGDYIMLENKRFVICDPTYIGAPVGATMPNMDNQSAKVILLD